MPIYEYECSKCHHIFEEWVRTSDAHDICDCPQCGAPAEHIISNTAFVLKGGGWYVTDYGYRKGVSESGDSASGGGTSAAPAASSEKAPAASSEKAPAAAETKAATPAAAPTPAAKPAAATATATSSGAV